MEIKEIFDVLKLTREFQKVQRAAKYSDDHFENDVEHSYQLAMVCWFIIERGSLSLNKELVFKYALAHDLVEIYAGDVNAHTDNSAILESKADKEHLAMLKIQEEFPDFKEMNEILEKYEAKSDEESLFVYMVDKFLPVMNTYLTKHMFYIENNVTFEKWKEWFFSKVKKEKANTFLYNEVVAKLIEFLDKEKDWFYAKEENLP